jgi:protein gp37
MMADKTEISWTDHTFNPWWGCTAIAPGCDNCYAAAMDKRTGGSFFDSKVKPRRTSQANWNKVLTWNRKAEKDGVRRKVFCGSMMDWCDKDAPEGALEDLFSIIRMTPMLDWQLLTKRATLIKERLPSDWGDGYPNVWIGITVEDDNYGYKRLEAFKDIKAKVKFISAEPLLSDISNAPLEGINWVIIGGESGPGARPMDQYWVDLLMGKCHLLGIPVWFKQWGGNTKDKGGNLINSNIHQNFPENTQ